MHMHPAVARALVQQHQAGLARMAGRRRRKKPPAVCLDGPQGLGVRIYLTDKQTRKLFAEWERLLAGLARRCAEPGRRGAAGYELVVLGRRVDEPADRI